MIRKGVKIMLYSIIIFLIVFIIAIIAGLFLPKERVEKRKSTYKISSKELFEIVTNNNDFSYRSDLKDLEIIETKGDIQTWKEIGKNEQTIVFRTTKKTPYSYYEFEIIKANRFSGYWTSEYKAINESETEFIATEHIVLPNPIIRLLSYIFIDIGKLMETYQNDLENKVNDTIKARNGK